MKNVFERAAGRAADSAATDFRAGSHFPARLMARALFWLLPLLFLLGAPCLASETGLVLSGYLTPGELVVPGEVTLSLTFAKHLGRGHFQRADFYANRLRRG